MCLTILYACKVKQKFIIHALHLQILMPAMPMPMPMPIHTAAHLPLSSLGEIIPLPGGMRDPTSRIPRPFYFVGAMFVSPAKHALEIPALMRSPHTIDAHRRQGLQGEIPRAHDGLPNVVQTVIPVELYLFWREIFDRLGIVGVPEKIEAVQLVEHGDAINFGVLLVVGGREGGGQAARQVVGDLDDAVARGLEALPGLVGLIVGTAP